MDEQQRVGIRELRQNLSVYVERVKAGERLEVTERGRPVAMLVPLPASKSVIDRLVAEGLAWPAEGSLSDLPPPIGKPSEEMSRRIREALDAEREDTI